MLNALTNKVGVALVTGAAITAIVLSQVAFAQRGDRNSASGVSSLIGRGTIRPNDDRFQPAAAMVLHEAAGGSDPAGLRGKTIFTRTIASDWINETVWHIPSRLARGEQMRPLTPSETLLMEELFSNDLSKSRGIEVNGDGIQGSVSPRDLGMKPQQIMEKARARGMQRSQWYQQAAAGLGPR
ncbi:MAG: hypothetical protein ACHQ50_07440 [Fimbriimonadales bacterium]